MPHATNSSPSESEINNGLSFDISNLSTVAASSRTSHSGTSEVHSFNTSSPEEIHSSNTSSPAEIQSFNTSSPAEVHSFNASSPAEVRSFDTSSSGGAAVDGQAIPMIPYLYPNDQRTEAIFCRKAGNPGCGGDATGGVVTFGNIRQAQGCSITPTVTIPRSFVRDIDRLRSLPGAADTLVSMLISGFEAYHARGYAGEVLQCIHRADHVSVRWLHLHTFCGSGRFEGMPGSISQCARMSSLDDAGRIAREWAR
ncbi:unnamed protein product [Polarella glacialis]|uniref:Uncharacterized protein n=1 Tax=Polarella glacialis TaxID=89957 RepID=A0A813JEK4_POLGL|nr:unnamed protein product [Polarella glacialis]